MRVLPLTLEARQVHRKVIVASRLRLLFSDRVGHLQRRRFIDCWRLSFAGRLINGQFAPLGGRLLTEEACLLWLDCTHRIWNIRRENIMLQNSVVNLHQVVQLWFFLWAGWLRACDRIKSVWSIIWGNKSFLETVHLLCLILRRLLIWNLKRFRLVKLFWLFVVLLQLLDSHSFLVQSTRIQWTRAFKRATAGTAWSALLINFARNRRLIIFVFESLLDYLSRPRTARSPSHPE